MTANQLQLKISGRVQGVFFRAAVKRWAKELCLAGFVRNEPDGSVYVLAQGSEEKLEELFFRCQQGSGSTQVEKIEAHWDNIHTAMYNLFEIQCSK